MKLKKLVEDLYQQMTGQTDDHEIEMAITDLRSLAHRAAQLADHFEKEKPKDLEGWVQAKITKAADYIGSVYDNHMFSPDQECDTCGDVNEGVIKVFSYAKPYTKSDATQLRAKADEYIKKLQSKNFNAHTGSDVVYFPEYKNLGPCFGVMAGSDTMIIQPVDSDKIFKVGESLLSRFMSDGRLEGYLLKGNMSEVMEPKTAYGDQLFTKIELLKSAAKKISKPENYSVLSNKDGSKLLLTTNNRAAEFAKTGQWMKIGKIDPTGNYREVEAQMTEAVSTCCGRCGHKHVKGTSCPKPFLTGKRHCRNRPR
jgi:hypothetical protein